jgi:hypothetical protein
MAMDSLVESIDLSLDAPVVVGRKGSSTIVLVRIFFPFFFLVFSPLFGRRELKAFCEQEDPTISATHCRFFFDNQVPLGSVAHPDLIRRHAELQQQAKLLWEPSRSVTTNGEVFYGASHFWVEGEKKALLFFCGASHV